MATPRAALGYSAERALLGAEGRFSPLANSSTNCHSDAVEETIEGYHQVLFRVLKKRLNVTSQAKVRSKLAPLPYRLQTELITANPNFHEMVLKG